MGFLLEVSNDRALDTSAGGNDHLVFDAGVVDVLFFYRG